VRRLLALVLMVVGGATGVALLLGSSGAQGSSSARFDVIFDDARGLTPGQLVKVAGARAGTIQNVAVTPDFKARIEATVDSQFMPFHKDATCTIRPEGLIAENFVECDPGSASSPPLKASGGHPPTVPVTNTTEPVSILDLFNMFDLPTRQRFQAIVNELGIGTAGRGQDFNDIIRRANPALALARQVISILARQRSQLATIVDATNTIAREGATHTANLQRFLDRAASLASLTAAHRDPLSQAIARLPGLLAASQPALQQLDTVAVDATPVIHQVHTAVPMLNQVSTDLGPFVKTAKPAIAKMTQTLKEAIPTIRATTPVVKTIRAYGQRSLANTKLFARLSSNLQRRGLVENFLSVTYYIAASLARFDATSHLLSILLVGANNGLCGNYATKPMSGCEAHFAKQAGSTQSSAAASRSTAATKRAQRAAKAGGTPGAASGSGTPAPGPSAPSSPNTPSAPSSGGSSTSAAPPAPAGGGGQTNPVQQTVQTLQSLTQYLLK
jgi:virulence factor Mce-like protein